MTSMQFLSFSITSGSIEPMFFVAYYTITEPISVSFSQPTMKIVVLFIEWSVLQAS